jgi:hypothetical protein
MRHKQSALLGVMSLSLITACTSFFTRSICQPVDFNFSENEFEVKTSLFFSTQVPTAIDKLLIILPPTGGTNLIDRSYAKMFCQKGYQVITLNDWTGANDKKPDFSLHQRVHQGAQKSLSLILSQFPAQFTGVLGTSLGGIFASTAAHNLEKIDAVFTITAGTPISDVIVNSKQKELEYLKVHRAQVLGITPAQVQIQKIREVFYLEPMDLPSLHKNKCLGMVIATKDTVVPANYQYQLRDFWQPQKVIEIHFDHFWGIVNTWLFYNKEIFNFFEKSYHKRSSKDGPTKC